jgi:peptidoglycan-associated lipoprotein
MKHTRVLFLSLFVFGWMGIGCQRSPDEVWNDTKTAGRHVGRGVDTAGGKQGSSRQIKDGSAFGDQGSGKPSDFVPLEDDRLNLQVGDAEAVPAPQDSPGDPGSPVPGIEAFRDPSQDPELAPIFEHVHFEYNSSLIKGDDSLRTIQKIADYMKSHPRLYVFVEGHCDKRGSASYNLALGANRANTVRTAIVQEGVSPDQLFTISYGKERPLFEDEGDEFFRLNRRAQFKVYEK